jgi:hypothetical protein
VGAIPTISVLTPQMGTLYLKSFCVNQIIFVAARETVSLYMAILSLVPVWESPLAN